MDVSEKLHRKTLAQDVLRDSQFNEKRPEDEVLTG